MDAEDRSVNPYRSPVVLDQNSASKKTSRSTANLVLLCLLLSVILGSGFIILFAFVSRGIALLT